MKLGRSAFLAGFVALGAWSMAACSSDNNKGGGDGGPDGATSTGGSANTGGSTNTGGSGASAGKTSTGGSGGSSTGGSSGSTSAGGSTTTVDGGNDGGVPSVKITSPTEGAIFTTSKVSVAFEVANFTLKPPGTGSSCKAGVCGHVHINVDGNDCNVNSTTEPYNNAGNTSPLDVDLTLCTGGASGAHSIVVSLHNDDHSAVTVNGKDVQSDPVDITAKLGDAGTGDAGDAGKK